MTGAAGSNAWPGYVAAYHDANPGITEDLLARARDDAGRTPYDWLLEALPPFGTAVDLACGSGPVVRRLGGRRAVGVDRSPGELARARRRFGERAGPPLVRADATALPLAPRTVDAVTASMALMVLDPIEPALDEIARVLRPGGRLVATVPTRPPAGADDSRAAAFRQILVQLGQARTSYPQPLHAASAGTRLAAAGLALLEDTAAVFVRRVTDEADAVLVVRSFYAPGATAAQVSAASSALAERVRDHPVDLGYRIRRLVAVAR